MSEVVSESDKDAVGYTWTLYDDCIVLPTSERISLWNAVAGGGKFAGLRLCLDHL